MKKQGLSLVGAVSSFVLLSVVDIVLGSVIPDRVLNIVFVATMSLVLIGLALVVYGTIVRNRWGINIDRVNCPRCQTPMPKIRKPKSRRERLWGGGTCDTCGCENGQVGQPNLHLKCGLHEPDMTLVVNCATTCSGRMKGKPEVIHFRGHTTTASSVTCPDSSGAGFLSANPMQTSRERRRRG
jgi:hypothetical protein